MRLSIISAAFAIVAAFAVPASAERLTDAPLVDATWLQDHLGSDGLIILDTRAPTDDANPYTAGHIPGAIWAPYGKFGWRATVDGVPGQLPEIPEIEGRIKSLGINDDTQVIIVPAGASSSEFGAATRVYWTFKVLGHDNVTILDGGMRDWQAADGALETEMVIPQQAGNFTADFRPQYYASTEEVAAAEDNGVRLVDGRPVDQFEGKAKSPVVRAPGTIPGAINLPQSRFYNAETASFVNQSEAQSLASDAGLSEDDETIAFCNTGHWASIAWFGLSEVDGKENVKMYDGSLAEWASDESRPLE
ncbi:UNVERIFIED_ORG: thiosulfate/3-mercaptopyruvate sulfurtransferase [Martelella mediterranea]